MKRVRARSLAPSPLGARHQPIVLPGKTSPPLARARAVERPALLERVDAVLAYALVLVVAPAGYGKTTLLVQWEERVRSRLPVAWVSLEVSDNDPSRFWVSILTALESQCSGLGGTALSYLRGSETIPMGALVETLVSELSGLSHQLVLVLDDYHVIQTPTIHASVSDLVAHLPQRAHLVISSRLDPPLPLAPPGQRPFARSTRPRAALLSA